MPDAHIEEELLNRYFDGDLAGESASTVATHLSQCGSCQSRLSTLQSLHDAITARAEESAREHDIDFDALFGRIERGIHAAPAPIDLSARRAATHKPRPARIWASAAGALAVAAGVLFAVRAGLQGTGGENSNIEIEQVAFNDDYGGTVFEVALAEGVSTRVVWINDYDDDDTNDGEEAIQ